MRAIIRDSEGDIITLEARGGELIIDVQSDQLPFGYMANLSMDQMVELRDYLIAETHQGS